MGLKYGRSSQNLMLIIHGNLPSELKMIQIR